MKQTSIIDSFKSNFLGNKQQSIAAILIFIATLFVLGFLGLRVGIPIANRILGMPDLNILEDYRPIGSIEIYDYEDNFVGVLQGKEDRQVVKLEEISDYMKQAVLAIEDSDFYNHSGISLIGVFRALTTNLKAGKVVQGGSTITQQMVKNLFITEDERYKRTLWRKVRELTIALEVEQKYDKDKILEIYLNQVYFGNRAYGVERAAQRYFSKSAGKLSLLEASYLGGLLTAPSYLAGNNEKAFERQRQVLKRMYKNGYISKGEYEEAKAAKLKFKRSKGNLSKFPYYFSYIEQELKKRFTPNELRQTGLKVYTGIDPAAQRLAKETLEIGIKNAAHGINQGALVMLDVPSGEIRALVGGVGDFWKHQYNRATNIHTLGSAFKPFVYLTAFIKGSFSPNSIIEDEEFELEDPYSEDMIWAPKNFDEEFHGPITVKAALIFSRNIPAIKVALKTGVKNIIETAYKAGVNRELQPLLSLALGAQGLSPLELATAYSTFARGGVHMNNILIRKITDVQGKVLELNKALPKSTLPEKEVSMLVDIMQDVVRFGTGALAKIPGRVIAGKTGTADGGRDIWFTGFTPDHVTTIWAGNEKNEEVLSRYATGGGTPAWIWREFMTKYYKKRPQPVRSFAFSNNFVTVLIDPLTGLLANEYTPNPVKKRFVPGTEPKKQAPIPEAENLVSRKNKRDLGRLFLGKRLSEEDERIRDLDEIKDKKRDDDESESKPKFIPKPKVFKIEIE